MAIYYIINVYIVSKIYELFVNSILGWGAIHGSFIYLYTGKRTIMIAFGKGDALHVI